jgi:hypothetical protein
MAPCHALTCGALRRVWHAKTEDAEGDIDLFSKDISVLPLTSLSESTYMPVRAAIH